MKIQTATLLPYLNPVGSACHLKICSTEEDRSVSDKALPFRLLRESDPLTRLIEAKMVTDGGSEIRRLFLLVQKDGYLLPKDPLWPVNNCMIDDLWQRAFSFFARGNKVRQLYLFSNQISERGKLQPLQSLFFCKITNLFFAPPCPQCGFPLGQCYDDPLLSRWGLQGYSVSLKRYLYCPSCCEQKGSRFYGYEQDSSDPPRVGDRWTLIKDFGFLVKSRGKITSFPCPSCSRNPECYGSELQALSRIVPFFFYPFYMFPFAASGLNALDFLSLVSGASLEELYAEHKTKREFGRIRCLEALKQEEKVKAPVLFEKDERFFLEVLYLKLSFLGQLIQGSFLADSGYEQPDLPLTIDETWVDIGNLSGQLPFFWNFTARYIGLGIFSIEPQLLPRLPTSYGLYSSGLAWFYSLLANKHQEMSTICMILRKAADRSLSEKYFSFEKFLGSNEVQASFLPVNIFWNPDGKVVREDWYPLWERSLLLGWSLLISGFQNGRDWQREEFMQKLEELREEVKGQLFLEEPVVGVSSVRLPETRTEDEAIYALLSMFLKKYSQETKIEEEELTETAVLAPDSKVEIYPPPIGTEETMPETMILAASQETREKGPLPRDSKAIESSRKMGESPLGQDFLTETVILGPAGIGSPSMGTVLEEEVPPGLEMEKAVIIAKTGQEPGEDDFLAETVVVKTEKDREKREKRGK